MKQMIRRQVQTAVLLVAALAVGVPASAQVAGERITILVPNLAPREGANDNFGQDVAEELRDLINELHTHQTVSEDELDDALDQFNLDEEALYDCIRARQLALRMGWGLVLCGEYTEQGRRQVAVNASFVGAEDGQEFEVPSFTANTREQEQAARQILQTFDRWQTQLRHTLFCQQYMDSQNWEAALQNCNQALAINPESKGALYRKAYTLYQMERNQEALETLETALEVDPIYQDALKLAGIVATEMGEREQARGYFDRYMELNPGDVQVRLTVATEIANAGDPAAALRFAQAGQENAPDNLSLTTYIGHFAANAAAQAEAQLSGGNGQAEGVDPAQVTEFYSTAADAYERVFQEQGTETDPTILEKLIIAKFKLGEIEEAVSLGERATGMLPDSLPDERRAAVWEAYSRALTEAGQTQEALAAIEQTEQLGRTSPALTQRRAMLQFETGNTDEGVAALEAAVEQGQLQPADAYSILFRHAYQDNFQQGNLSKAYRLLDEAGPLAVREEDRLSRNFWRGYILFRQAEAAHEPMTAASAAEAKPLFERALELFQAARGYEQIHASADVPRMIQAAQQYIEIEDALIRRGS